MNGATIEQVAALRAARPEHKWKVQSANERNCLCVAYVDARTVQDVLDDVLGPQNWATKYHQVGDRLICELAININGTWISKADCGTDTKTEGEKGGLSDAFKRAAVNWGVGRFLYRLERVNVPSVKNTKGNYVPGENGKPIWDLTDWVKRSQGSQQRPRPAAQAPAQPKAQAAEAPAQVAQPAADPARALADAKYLQGLKAQIWNEVKRLHPGSSEEQWIEELEVYSDAFASQPLAVLDIDGAHRLLERLKRKPTPEPSPLQQVAAKK